MQWFGYDKYHTGKCSRSNKNCKNFNQLKKISSFLFELLAKSARGSELLVPLVWSNHNALNYCTYMQHIKPLISIV